MKFAQFATLLLAAATLSAPALAQVSKDPASVQAGTYNADPDHTQVFWSIDHLGFMPYQGRFDKTAGSLTLDPKTPANDAVDVTIAIDSVDTPSAKLNGELVSPVWFDAKKFPTMTFKSTKIVRTNKDNAKVTGDLTLHGVTKPVTLDVKFFGVGPNPFFKVYSVGFTATGKVKRTDFGVSYGAPVIGDDTTITINATFVKP